MAEEKIIKASNLTGPLDAPPEGIVPPGCFLATVEWIAAERKKGIKVNAGPPFAYQNSMVQVVDGDAYHESRRQSEVIDVRSGGGAGRKSDVPK